VRCRAPRAAGSRAGVRNAVPLLVTVTSARARARAQYRRASARILYARLTGIIPRRRATRFIYPCYTHAASRARFPERRHCRSLASFFRHFGPRALALRASPPKIGRRE